jgi:hypothetical protein
MPSQDSARWEGQGNIDRIVDRVRELLEKELPEGETDATGVEEIVAASSAKSSGK